MKALSVETYYPKDQYQKKAEAESLEPEKLNLEEHYERKPDAKGYEIKPLDSLQLTEVMSTGFDATTRKMTFQGIMLLLKYGLKDPSEISRMRSIHHIDVSQAIYNKAALAEAERKN